MSNNAAIVANTLIQRSFKESRVDMTPMKVQKLLWFLNGWNLAVTGVPAIIDPFHAWKFGPVMPSVYHELKRFGSSNVTEYIKEYNPDSESFVAYVVGDDDTTFKEIFDMTWEKYIGIPALTLSAMTHAADSPWTIAWKAKQQVISSELIKNYFIRLARH